MKYRWLIRDLDIRTGDEIENLYHAITGTTEAMVQTVQNTERPTLDPQAKQKRRGTVFPAECRKAFIPGAALVK